MERGQDNRAGALTSFVALLRGVNVGGANRLPMAGLSAIFQRAGARRVETVIQSGNVVFDAEARAASGIAKEVAAQIFSEFGFAAPIVLRDAAAWRAMVAGNPFLPEADPKTLHALCLTRPPEAGLLAALDTQRSPPDRFAARGDVIYLCLPNGVARSKLTNAWFDARLGLVSTARNWPTVLKLAEALERRG